MTFYLQVMPWQTPYDFQPDATGRKTLVFNMQAIHEPTASFAEEISGYLNREELYSDTSEQMFGTKTLIAGKAGKFHGDIDDDYVRITKVFGQQPDSTHEQLGKYQRTVAQIMCSSEYQRNAEKMANKAYNMLSFSNQELEPINI